MALPSRRNREVFIDEYNFIYTYVASNKDSDKKYWICEKRRECNVRVHTINGNIVYRSSEHSHAPDTGTIAAIGQLLPRWCMQLQPQKVAQGISLEMLHQVWTSCRAKKTYRMIDARVSNIVRDYANRTFTSFCVLLHTTCDFNLLTKRVHYKKDWLAVSDS